MKYARFIERNDNEGETWIRWIPETDKKLSVLKEYLATIDLEEEGFDSDAYELELYDDGDIVLYDEAYVNVTLEETEFMCGYFYKYAVCNIHEKFSLDWIELGYPGEQLYKLQHLVEVE